MAPRNCLHLSGFEPETSRGAHPRAPGLYASLLSLIPLPTSFNLPFFFFFFCHNGFLQLYAVVLLYNYYHRKQHPQLEFLCFENFCKLAVVVKPALLAHIRLLQRSNDTKSQTFPLLEERIMEACSISMSLDASEDDLNIEGWPISRVAVLLIDSKKENCFLQFGSITEGVWSVIEKIWMSLMTVQKVPQISIM